MPRERSRGRQTMPQDPLHMHFFTIPTPTSSVTVSKPSIQRVPRYINLNCLLGKYCFLIVEMMTWLTILQKDCTKPGAKHGASSKKKNQEYGISPHPAVFAGVHIDKLKYLVISQLWH